MTRERTLLSARTARTCCWPWSKRSTSSRPRCWPRSARRARATPIGRWWSPRPRCTRAIRVAGAGHEMPYPFGTRDGATSPLLQSLTRALEHQRSLFATLPGRGATLFVPIDFTQPGDGFEPADYGREALVEALVTAAPSRSRHCAERAAGCARRYGRRQVRRSHHGICAGRRRQRCVSRGRNGGRADGAGRHAAPARQALRCGLGQARLYRVRGGAWCRHAGAHRVEFRSAAAGQTDSRSTGRPRAPPPRPQQASPPPTRWARPRCISCGGGGRGGRRRSWRPSIARR